MAKKSKKKQKLVEKTTIPQDLLNCYDSIQEELTDKKFKLTEVIEGNSPKNRGYETYLNDKQKVVLEIHSENIVVRQYELQEDKDKMLAIYVQKPQQRTFKLV